MVMHRRRVTKDATIPLYTLPTGTWTNNSSRDIAISNGNHMKITAKANTAGNQYITLYGIQNSKPSAVWFNLHEGDVIRFNLKNFVYSTGGSARTLKVGFANGENTTQILVATRDFQANKTNATRGNVSYTSDSFTADRTIVSMWIYSAIGGLTVDFDIELWINGQRYI